MGLFGEKKPDPQLTRLLEEVSRLTREIASLKGQRDSLKEVNELEGMVLKLKKQISDLEVEKSKKEEAFDRRERELQHHIGLERKRSETESSLAKREAQVGVREENLKAERKSFEDQMAFREKQFTEQQQRLENLLTQILKRLPTVELTRTEMVEVAAARPAAVRARR